MRLDQKLINYAILCISVICIFLCQPRLAMSEGVQPLVSEQAFQFSLWLNANNQLVAKWQIAPGYYLYQDALSITATPTSQVHFGAFAFPMGQHHEDALGRLSSVYTGTVEITIPLKVTIDQKTLDVTVRYQGCSKDGFCYAPIDKHFQTKMTPLSSPKQLEPFNQAPVMMAHEQTPSLTQPVQEFSFGWVLLSSLGLGILLAFTPCVLPMIPILSGIIVGQGKDLTVKRAFLLALSYVIGMAVMYTTAGMGIALLGSNLQIILQRPWVIGWFSAFFVLLGIALLKDYPIQLPAFVRQRITHWTGRQVGGNYWGVFLMGGLSSLVVSPCVSAPLAGILAYVGQRGDVLLGATALFLLSMGMGLPLLLVGLFGGNVLPKAGPWLSVISHITGFLMLAMAIWIGSRVMPGSIILMLWAIWFASVTFFITNQMKSVTAWRWIRHGVFVLFMSYSVVMLIGAWNGHSDPLHPWAKTPIRTFFQSVQTDEAFNALLMEAKKENKSVFLDFYADWCTACVAMDKKVFPDPRVQKALLGFISARVDVTHQTPFDRDMMSRFHVIAPPTMVLLNDEGIESHRIVGETDVTDLLKKLNAS